MRLVAVLLQYVCYPDSAEIQVRQVLRPAGDQPPGGTRPPRVTRPPRASCFTSFTRPRPSVWPWSCPPYPGSPRIMCQVPYRHVPACRVSPCQQVEAIRLALELSARMPQLVALLAEAQAQGAATPAAAGLLLLGDMGAAAHGAAAAAASAAAAAGGGGPGTVDDLSDVLGALRRGFAQVGGRRWIRMLDCRILAEVSRQRGTGVVGVASARGSGVVE